MMKIIASTALIESELKATQDGTKNGRNRYMQGNTKHIDKNTKPCSSFVLEPGDVLVLEGAALRSRMHP